MAADDSVPNSYKDPYWTNLASGVESKLDLPAGLLQAIVTKGEKSNNDAVSSDGARTPFQIIPATRKAAIANYGIDPYLSPQNAADVAGRLLKDSLDRNGGSVPQAVGEYIGGTDRKNWGNTTQSYIMRVTDAQKPIQQAALDNGFQQWMAAHPAVPAPAAPAPVAAGDALAAGFAHFMQNGGGKPPAPTVPEPDPDMAAGLQPIPILGNVANAEALGSTLSGMAGSAVGGLAGLGTAAGNALGLTNANPADVVRKVAGAMTYEPRTTQGGAGAAALNYIPAKIGQAGDAVGGAVTDLTGSPALGAAANAALQVGGPALLGKVGGGVVGAVDAIKRTPTLTAESMALPEIDPRAAALSSVAEDPATTVPQPVVPPPAAPLPATGDVPVTTSVQDVAQAARKAAEGTKGATQDLVDIAAPDPKTVAAAARLGIGDYLQSDHVTTNDGYRQVVGVLKSDPTSELALAEKTGLAKVAERASNLIDEVGGTTDLSSLDAGVKGRMQTTHAELKAREDGLYDKVRQAIPAASDAPATSTLDFIAQRAKDLGGEQNLTPMEKQIVAKLSPKGGGDAALLDALGPEARKQAIAQGAKGATQPTYALLDDVRKDVGAAAGRGGPFSDADTGLAKKLYGTLSDDQGAAADTAGAGNLFAQAKAATVVRKGMENDLASLFGKNLDGSLVGDVGQAMKAASGGDTSKLINVLRATPDAMKGEVVASGLQTVFRNAATRGEINFTGYAKWFEGLLRNKQAYAAVMSNLPKTARKQLSDLYRVSKGISDSLNARIKTGLRSSVLEAMNAPDALASKLYKLAGAVGKGLAVDVVGGHGAGMATALYSALSRNKTPAAKAIDSLLTSSEFVNLARNAGTPRQPAAVADLSNSAPFRRFMRAVHQQNATGQWREQWISRALLPPPVASTNRN